jgi:hypothetical protein
MELKELRIWMRSAVACSKELPRHLPSEAEENYENVYEKRS